MSMTTTNVNDVRPGVRFNVGYLDDENGNDDDMHIHANDVDDVCLETSFLEPLRLF